MSDDLVKRLRTPITSGEARLYSEEQLEAADRIEELEAALRPFEACILWEKADGTVGLSTDHLRYADWLRLRTTLYRRTTHDGTPEEQLAGKRLEIDEPPER